MKTGYSSFSTIVVFVLLALIGLALIPKLSVQLSPNRSLASVSVSCAMSGASAEVVELELTAPIEGTLARLKGVSSMVSTSDAGRSYVRVSLDKWADPEAFRFEAAAILRQLYPKLPQTATYPQVYLNRPGGSDPNVSMMGYTLNGPGTGNDIAQMAERLVRPVLARIKGIDRLEISGQRPERYALLINAIRLGQANLDFGVLQGILSQGMATTDLGRYLVDRQDMTVFVDRSIGGMGQLPTFAVSNKAGRVLRLGDLADIVQEEAPVSSLYRINGQELISLNIHAEDRVNRLQLAEQIKKEMRQLAGHLPLGYRLELAYDHTDHIRNELAKIYLRTTLSLAILLTFVLFITRHVRYLLIVVSSLLVNVLLAFICYYLFRIEIHLYSMAGITISLGLVVDNAIVIVEDLRHTGRNRIFAAILASTLTALGALSVIFLLEEEQRMRLLDFALAIIINLLVSLPIAYFFIPAMVQRFPVHIKNGALRFRRKRRLVGLTKSYRTVLRIILRYRMAAFLLFLLSFGLPLFLLPNRLEGNEAWKRWYNASLGSDAYRSYLREPLQKYLGGSLYLFFQGVGSAYQAERADEKTMLYVNVSMPLGSSLQQMDHVVRHFEQFLSGYGDKLELFTAYVADANHASLQISFLPEHEHTFPHRLKQLLESEAIGEGAADFAIYGVGRGFSNAINLDTYDSSISLKGYNYSQLRMLALALRDSLLMVPRVSDVLISSRDRYDARAVDELHLRVDDVRQLSRRQIAKDDVGAALSAISDRNGYLGLLPVDSTSSLPVHLLLNRGKPPEFWQLLHAPVQANDSVMLRISDVGKVERIRGTESITRQDQAYVLHVHYRFIGTYELNRMVAERITGHFAKLLPFGYSFMEQQYDGWWGGKDGSYTQLWLILLVLTIIYLICAALLESLTQPLVVVLMVPFSFIGVFLIFYLLGLRPGQGSYAALLMVSALVTNTALYVINDLNFIRGEGDGRVIDQNEAIKSYSMALNTKAMPILITTASAVLSLLPFIISGDEQGFWFTLSTGTIGGLLFSLLGAHLLLPLCLLPKKSVNKKMDRKR